MIIDSFPFFNEIELLDLRLNYLQDKIDRFIIVEGTKSHQGKEKRLYYDENKSLFKKFENKIVHYIVDDYPKISDLKKFDHFSYDYHTRNSISKALKTFKNGERDILLISDVDEIPNKNFFSKFKGKITIFKQYMLYFFMNLKCESFDGDIGDGFWPGTRMLYLKDYTTAQKIRNIKGKKYSWWRIDKPKVDFFNHAGWHFRFLGNQDDLFEEFKNRSIGYYEQILKTYSKDDLKKIIENKLELIGGEKYSLLDDKLLPSIILENKNLYKKYFLDDKEK